MTRLERELLTRIKARLDALDPGAAEKLAVLLPVLRRFAQSYAALGAAAKKTVEALLPELAALLEAEAPRKRFAGAQFDTPTAGAGVPDRLERRLRFISVPRCFRRQRGFYHPAGRAFPRTGS